MNARKPTLRGTLTALVTPMNRDGSVDMGALDALVDAQLDAGIEGLVPCGTTGEAVTLTAAEREAVVKRVVARTAGRVPVVAGAGANSTAVTIEAVKRARDTGATASLVVTPYYNKPTPEGLFRHYAAVAEAVDFPMVLYNVPGRTGCDLKPATAGRLGQFPSIIGIKEATGDLDRVAAIRKLVPAGFVLLSGDDGTSCPFVLLGGDGVISVSSHIAAREMVTMIRAALAGEVEAARREHHRLRELFVALFLEANPIPVKAALAMQGRVQEVYRLPMCEMSAEPKEKLRQVLRAGGWLS
jgi:4-hydroxy-tetrahydrodipicolinate synthase